MEMNEYQTEAIETAIYPGKKTVDGLIYCALGLGEAGEFQGKVKKILRDDNGVLTNERKLALRDELGDVLWYVANLASELGYNLDAIAALNLMKLSSRAERGVIGGSGDYR